MYSLYSLCIHLNVFWWDWRQPTPVTNSRKKKIKINNINPLNKEKNSNKYMFADRERKKQCIHKNHTQRRFRRRKMCKYLRSHNDFHITHKWQYLIRFSTKIQNLLIRHIYRHCRHSTKKHKLEQLDQISVTRNK